MIIVTGGAGFIGSGIVWKLNQLGEEKIIVVDHLGTTEKWKNLSPLSFSDYLEKDAFEAKIRTGSANEFGKIDGIVHMGACSATTEVDASYLARNNFEYSKLVAQFALKKKARLVYASSAATYGDGSNGFKDDEKNLAALRPLNMYGYSKQMFDVWCRKKGLLNRFAGVKFFNVYGPNEFHKGDMRSVVLKAFEQIRVAGHMSLFKSYRSDYADGEQLRDFIYVKDAVDMTLHLLEKRTASGIFNVGSGKPNSWNNLARAIFSALRIDPEIRYIEMPEKMRNKYQYYTCADISKLRKSGYKKPITPFADSVVEYIREYLLQGKRLGE
ncbi:MAG TPA: ADP-glyceromanno-heptose 6-epimerase [Candidatus Kryptonia bacterium]